jgi:hypothetical protein
MIYPEVEPKSWSAKHGVPLHPSRCYKCGKEVSVDIPVISKDYVGFTSEDHGCGPEYIIIHVKPRHDKVGLIK